MILFGCSSFFEFVTRYDSESSRFFYNFRRRKTLVCFGFWTSFGDAHSAGVLSYGRIQKKKQQKTVTRTRPPDVMSTSVLTKPKTSNPHPNSPSRQMTDRRMGIGSKIRISLTIEGQFRGELHHFRDRIEKGKSQQPPNIVYRFLQNLQNSESLNGN